jgi:outer membrane protein OmpA-like peptidoglycan-associated protein
VKRAGAPLWLGSTVTALIVSAGCGPKRAEPLPRPPIPEVVQVVLLADPESTAPTAVTVTAKPGTVALTSPTESTTVFSNRPPMPLVKMDEAEIQRQFGALLANLPEAPRHFNLYFREATADLTDESRAILPDILTAVKAREVPEVTVIGHTDTTGSTASNYQLGLQRAQSVRALLLKAGLDASLVDVESHGEADLLQRTPDNTDEPRNRRVEITIR